MIIVKMISKLLLFVNLFMGAICCGDFYWRDYEGIIPTDAIPGESNSYGSSYIGQAYLHNVGLLVGTIVVGRKDMYFWTGELMTVNTIIKILCAQDKRKYYWLPTTSSTYAEDTSYKCPVLAGYDQRIQGKPLGTLHIGRTRKHGAAIVANIPVYYNQPPPFIYPLNNSVGMQTNEYEVLMYSGYPIQTIG